VSLDVTEQLLYSVKNLIIINAAYTILGIAGFFWLLRKLNEVEKYLLWLATREHLRDQPKKEKY
jgi:hypothetical protein